jgi:cell division protein FtsQ
MQDYRQRRPKPRRFSLRRQSKKSNSTSQLTPSLGRQTPARAPLSNQPRAPRHRVSTFLRRSAAALRPVLRPRRLPAGLWFLLGMLWLGGGIAWTAAQAWDAPLSALNIEGEDKLTPVQIAAAAGLYPGVPVGGLDPLRMVERLLALPRIAEAEVRRTLPGRVDIRIQERRPAAVALLADGRTAVLDREGVVLDTVPPKGLVGDTLPRLRGGGAEVQEGRRLGDGPLRRGLDFVAGARSIAELNAEPWTVDARDTFSIRVSLEKRGRQVILPARAADAAMRAYLDVETALEAASPGYRTADARALPRSGVAWIALSR